MIDLRFDNDPYKNYPRLKWRNSDTKDYTYRVFRRKISSTINTNISNEDFQAICVSDINDKEECISVLNLHPNAGEDIEFTDYVGETISIKESEILKKWLYEPSSEAPNGYGKGKIEVHSMSISEFNSDPINKLNNESGLPKYDVVCIGFFDGMNYSNQNQVLNSQSVNILGTYVDKGYGVLIGHDVISGLNGNKGLGTIRDKFGVYIGKWDNKRKTGYDYNFKLSYEGKSVNIIKAGSLMQYPWSVGTIGDTFNIAPTHTSSQIIGGTRWLDFNPTNVIGEENIDKTISNKGNCYLSTFKNTAMIQAGNDLNITSTEKKLIANTIFYINQITRKKEHIDYMGIDDEKPMTPTIINYYTEADTCTATFDYKSDDIGVNFEYYVEGTNVDSGEVTLSNVISVTYTSEIETYKYKIEQVESDAPNAKVCNDWVHTKDRVVISEPLKRGYHSFKVVAVDKNLNISDIKEVIFFAPGIIVREKSPAITKYPNAQRVNHRYRGPHESRKAKDVIVQIKYNLNNIKKIVDELDKSKSILLERPSVDFTSIQESTRVIDETNSFIVKNETR